MLALVRRRTFALVWVGGLVSLTGDWALITALPLVVFQMTDSTLALGLTLMVRAVPRLIVGSIAGVFVDRWDRRQTMLVSDVLLGLGLLPLLLVTSADLLWLLALVLFVESIIVQFYRSAEGALLPRLVPQDELVPANALNALNTNLARLVGPPVGALLVALSGLVGVVLLDMASFLLAALALLVVHIDPGEARPAGNHTLSALWTEWVEGLKLAWTERIPRVVLLFMAIAGVGEGVMSALFVPFTTEVLHGSELTYGALLSAQAAGGFVGSIAVGRFARRIAPEVLLGGGSVLLGVIDLLIFYSPRVADPLLAPLLLMVLVGGPSAAMAAGYLTLMQTAVADDYRGRVLGLLFTTLALAGLVGMALGGLLGDRLGIVPLLTLDGVAYVVAGCVVLVMTR